MIVAFRSSSQAAGAGITVLSARCWTRTAIRGLELLDDARRVR